MNTKFLLSSDNNNRNELLKKKIIHYYIANGDATIADLGREMDLSIPTVTKLVAELQDDGYILDFGKQETNGGRKPNIYGLNPASGYFVGVDMLKDKLNIAAIDFKGDKVQLEENIPYQLENTPASLEQFCKIIDDFIVSLPVERNKILAIGVNITGRVNPASGYSYSIFYFEEKPLAQIMEKIKGLIDAPFTPFYENGEVNYEPIEAYAKLLVKNGLKGVFINGSSGEGYMLTDEERMKLAERWVEVAPSGFKVIVHVGSTCVKASHKLAAHAQKIGAWGIGAMASPFPKVNRIEELVKYCEEIASGAPELPFYYYHIPAFNGAFLPMVELLKAVDGRIPNFAGIKYTYESLYEYNQCRLYKDGKFDMLHGQDETILPCLAMGGAQGGIGGTTNYNGKELTGILEAWAAGDLETARERQNFSQEVINVICRYRGNIVGGKRIMKLIGLDLGKNRTPFQNMTDEEETAMKAELEAIHFFDRCNKF